MNNFVIEHLIWQETTIPINLTNITFNDNSVNSVQSLSHSLVSVFSLPKEPTYNMQFSCPYRRIPVAVKFRYSEKAISSYMYCCHRIVSSLFLWIVKPLSNNISLVSSVCGLRSWAESRFLFKKIVKRKHFLILLSLTFTFTVKNDDSWHSNFLNWYRIPG